MHATLWSAANGIKELPYPVFRTQCPRWLCKLTTESLPTMRRHENRCISFPKRLDMASLTKITPRQILRSTKCGFQDEPRNKISLSLNPPEANDGGRCSATLSQQRGHFPRKRSQYRCLRHSPVRSPFLMGSKPAGEGSRPTRASVTFPHGCLGSLLFS